MVDGMSMDPRQSWSIGSALLMIPVIIGVGTVFFDVPPLMKIVIVVVIIALVFFGTRLIFHRKGGWRPSDTLANQTPANDH